MTIDGSLLFREISFTLLLLLVLQWISGLLLFFVDRVSDAKVIVCTDCAPTATVR